MRLRGHHLFCATLFQGYGYDGEFVARMQEVLSALGQGAISSAGPALTKGGRAAPWGRRMP